MRDRIKSVATELLINYGYRGLRFKDIAEQLGTTRANIHYHFGTKKNLIEEVIEDYVEGTLVAVKAIWTAENLPYVERVRRMMAFNRERYNRFNPPGKDGRPWSIISRMRLESDVLSKKSKETLHSFSRTAEAYIKTALDEAIARGEISGDAPARDILVQIVAIMDSAGSITSDAGSFDRLEHLYTAYIHVLTHAYGGEKAPHLVAVAE
ncbi:TetR/AcrR family transcriptional regulator [Oceanibaculum nanhaiense]|jgi:TetR/AcrR family transcriptional regulator, transcriptional repressor for nem operon|uniref:TetR/AcrR family transcriptional regulator n=1 Tax=Oceanibaculum nanhaiense TaxID=1909734 RepID=UPI000A3C8078|nr:TetR/AcrR family transcriptional regulator [Oceanibaculum nanhaiense]MBC7134340.1 TetR/AcrR family transcriptional regulator [Oceanibaculum nanhaiense]MDM7947342.1 TetR/AcrR family transcriptional regulator [Oceanibaculum nanhaiense]